jgi:hypothetical protein
MAVSKLARFTEGIFAMDVWCWSALNKPNRIDAHVEAKREFQIIPLECQEVNAMK